MRKEALWVVVSFAGAMGWLLGVPTRTGAD
jgi:hypothetical protein